jgi:hypothetical protein
MITARVVYGLSPRGGNALSGVFPIDNTVSTGKLAVLCNVTAMSGTSPTVNFELRWTIDNGTTWFTDDVFAAAVSQVTAAPEQFAVVVDVKGLGYQVNMLIGGTTPSVTSSVGTVMY